MITLKDLCDKGSSNIAQKDIENNNGEYPIYGASGLIKKVDFYKQSSPYIAIVKDGAGVGRVMKLPAMSSVIGTMQYIIPNKGVNVDYLAHALESMNLAKYHSGATIPHIYFKDYCKELLPEHSKAEQEHIAATLSKIDSLITARREQLAKLDELVKSRFIEMFGNVRDNEKNWEKVSLKSVAEVRGRVGWKGYKKDDLRESGPFVLGATHLTESGCIDLSSPVYLSREKYEESPEIMLQKNDLIFTQRGNTIGKVGLLENDIGEATINPCVLILRPLTINPIYFKTYFILDETKSDMWSLNAGSAQPMITQKGIGEYMLMLPPLELQEQFATFVKQTDKSKFEIQKSLEKLETLKKALMQKYFG